MSKYRNFELAIRFVMPENVGRHIFFMQIWPLDPWKWTRQSLKKVKYGFIYSGYTIWSPPLFWPLLILASQWHSTIQVRQRSVWHWDDLLAGAQTACAVPTFQQPKSPAISRRTCRDHIWSSRPSSTQPHRTIEKPSTLARSEPFRSQLLTQDTLEPCGPKKAGLRSPGFEPVITWLRARRANDLAMRDHRQSLWVFRSKFYILYIGLPTVYVV
jgi:hypothetical protein